VCCDCQVRRSTAQYVSDALRIKKAVCRRRRREKTALVSRVLVAITTREYYTQMRAERRRHVNNATKHRASFSETSRRQLANTTHYSTRRSMSQHGTDKARRPTSRSIDDDRSEWRLLSRALAPASPSDLLPSYTPTSIIIISAKCYLPSVHWASTSYYVRTRRAATTTTSERLSERRITATDCHVNW